MSGGFRTFSQTKDSFRKHVLEHLYHLGYLVDLYVCITLDDSFLFVTSNTAIEDNEERIRRELAPFRPVKIDFITKDEAKSVHTSARQLYGIDKCFALTEPTAYDYYMRVRPDYFYLYNIPDPLSRKDMVHSCAFDTAKNVRGCDLIFSVPASLYESWWKQKIRPIVRQEQGELGAAIEYWIFDDIPVFQDRGFEGGVLRGESKLQMWIDPDLEKSLSPSLGLTRF